MSQLASQSLPGGSVSNPMKSRNGLHTLTALIIDDNVHMRRLLRTLLIGYGLNDVHDAADGETGIRMLNRVKPDFVLCDYDMKPMNGIGFVKAVRNTCPPPLAWIPIIMITAHAERRRLEKARDAGITEALLKPVTPRNLYDRIVQIIERPRRFVKTPQYAGPDRRRRKDANYKGPERRLEDRAETDIREV
ncbi:MAG TPA: response regulator [Micropepsaceae bacterium]|nr:response regulator [Micropepsaceae bacterium]